MGQVKGLLVDEETWAIRYLIVETSNWWFGHQVLIAPQWIQGDKLARRHDRCQSDAASGEGCSTVRLISATESRAGNASTPTSWPCRLLG